jgi:2-polyprenyl-6-methoxyphenol hydroxylase-like FAD-dependent oxidoreductase
VVIGGSMAGLLTARILADHFDGVTVLERDRYAESPGPRRGIPQGRHAHVLLGRGQEILQELFPGIADELQAAGAPLVDTAGDIAWRTPEGWSTRFPSRLTMLSASRDLLDWTVRRHVAALPSVSFQEGAEVIGLATDPSGRAVTGVKQRRRQPGDHSPPNEEWRAADLVVDTGGRGSRAPQWLEALGFGRPEETVVNAFLGYASRIYGIPAGAKVDWKALYVQSKPPSGTRDGLILPVEGGRWIVTLSGRGGDYPPTDETGFLAFARSLSDPKLYAAIRDAEPLSAIAGFRGTENRLRHFERLDRWPEGFVVLGDAACALNPAYGQGMTAAGLGALALGQCLRRRGPGLAKRFQAALATVNTVPWLFSTGEDFRSPATVGGRPGWRTRWQHHYVNQVVRLATHDAGVRLTLLKVLHLLQPPTALFRPGILWALLRQVLWPATARATEGPAAVQLPAQLANMVA